MPSLGESLYIEENLWWRYIDDIFTIWDKGQDLLDSFLQHINHFHPTIEFTAETSTDKVSFLDVTVILEGNTIQTDLYTKPTDTHQYLSPESCHPRHCTTLIPYSQSLRIRRICSREDDFTRRLQELKSHLIDCGYNESMVDSQFKRTLEIQRHTTLQPPQQRPTLNRVPFVTTFHPSLSTLTKSLRKHLPILHSFQRLKQALPEPPLVAFRRPKNL